MSRRQKIPSMNVPNLNFVDGITQTSLWCLCVCYSNGNGNGNGNESKSKSLNIALTICSVHIDKIFIISAHKLYAQTAFIRNEYFISNFIWQIKRGIEKLNDAETNRGLQHTISECECDVDETANI